MPRASRSWRAGRGIGVATAFGVKILFPAAAGVLLASVLANGDVRDRPTAVVGDVTTYIVRAGDTLSGIGARVGADAAGIAADNGFSTAARLVAGQILRIDNRHIVPGLLEPRGLLINVPQRMLFFGADDGVEGYPVAVGRSGWETPIGPFVVTAKETNPTWDVPRSILDESRRRGREQPARVLPGPHNPLGTFWIGLSLPGIGIHGTNAPSSIFRVATHGCIRLQEDAIARLFGRVATGTRGRIIYEPLLLAEQDGAVFLEVHRDVYRRASTPAVSAARALAQGGGLSERIDWTAADLVLAARHGIARDVTRLQR